MSVLQLCNMAQRNIAPLGTVKACRTMSSVTSTLATRLQEGPGLADFVRASADPLSAPSPGSQQVQSLALPLRIRPVTLRC